MNCADGGRGERRARTERQSRGEFVVQLILHASAPETMENCRSQSQLSRSSFQFVASTCRYPQSVTRSRQHSCFSLPSQTFKRTHPFFRSLLPNRTSIISIIGSLELFRDYSLPNIDVHHRIRCQCTCICHNKVINRLSNLRSCRHLKHFEQGEWEV